MGYGKRFKYYRLRGRMAQKEAAKQLGVKPYQLANYESDRSEPNLRVLIGMSKLYHVSIDQLLGIARKSLPEPSDDSINQLEAERQEMERSLKSLLRRFGIIDKEQ